MPFLLLVSASLAAPAARAQHDCVPYTPTEAGQVINGQWEAPGDQDDYQIVIPADPGGGYVIASVATTAPAEPMMRIIPPSGQGTVTQQGTLPAPGGPSPHTLTVVFDVDASTTFDVEIIEDVSAPVESHPVAYQWSWTFTSQVDCYEPNDGSPSTWPDPMTTAREIPLDQIHEAYSLIGHLSFGISNDSDHSWDWYRFTLAAPTNLWFATTQVPSDQRFRMRLWGTDGHVEASGPNPDTGGNVHYGPRLIPAGTWYLEVHPFDNGEEEATLSEGESIPDHFVTPYRFVVSTEPIPECFDPAVFVFCDGFESGGTGSWSTAVF